jgi:hypothetical protein
LVVKKLKAALLISAIAIILKLLFNLISSNEPALAIQHSIWLMAQFYKGLDQPFILTSVVLISIFFALYNLPRKKIQKRKIIAIKREFTNGLFTLNREVLRRKGPLSGSLDLRSLIRELHIHNLMFENQLEYNQVSRLLRKNELPQVKYISEGQKAEWQELEKIIAELEYGFKGK